MGTIDCKFIRWIAKATSVFDKGGLRPLHSYHYRSIRQAFGVIATNFDSAAIMSSLSTSQGRWVHTWASMPMLIDGDNLPPHDFVSKTASIGNDVNLYCLGWAPIQTQLELTMKLRL